jgi:flagellar hook assembly protein FlgD
VKRLPVAAFVALAIVTIAAFFVTQHLKVSTPLLDGFPAPAPSAINPVDGRVCAVRSHNGTVKLVNHRRMLVSFYLLNRSDDVDVSIVDPDGELVKTIGSDVHMQASPPVRKLFIWDGRTASGSIAPDGTYYIKVSLIQLGRSVLISNNSGAEPVTVLTVPPRPVITSVTPSVIASAGGSGATIHYTGAAGHSGRILVYRTGLPGGPQLLKSFASRGDGSSVWDGTAPGRRPAPPGTYTFRLEVTDRACNMGFYPVQWPPVSGAPATDRVTLR